EVGAGAAERDVREPVEVDVLGQRLGLRLHGADLPATLLGGVVDEQVLAEATGPQDGLIERVEAVGGRDADDPAGRVEPVELDEQLVERLLALVVATDADAAALLGERVELVEEDDRRGVLVGVGEQRADARSAAADDHLDELRARDREERDAGLPRERLRKQRLAGAG